MRPSFDLLDDPWLPCIRLDGGGVLLGLRDALVQAHDLLELGGDSPIIEAALYRLLLVVIHRVFGPPSHDVWGALWNAGRWEPARIDTYFDAWCHRFDLFDTERPFLQAPDPGAERKSVISLIPHAASGNNPTLFDHQTEAVGLALTPAEAARAVITAQAFGLAGLSGIKQNFTDGTCARGIIFFVQGDSLFETLALNLVRYPDQKVMHFTPEDAPAWEMDDPYMPNRSIPLGYLDYLTWQSRRILLYPEVANGQAEVRQMSVAPGLRLDKLVLDPMKHYQAPKSKEGRLRALRFREERTLWRDSAALFRVQRFQHDREVNHLSPWAFHWLATLVTNGYLDERYTPRFLALGMANHRAKVHFYRREQFLLLPAYLRDAGVVGDLEQALGHAEAAARGLWGVARTLARYCLVPLAGAESVREPRPEDLDRLTQRWAIERGYWSRLELPFRQFVELLPTRPELALAEWADALRRTAWRAFDQVAQSLDQNPKTLKAVVLARARLASGLAKIFEPL